MKFSDLIKLSDDFLLKMPLGESVTAAGFEIVFKRNGFFFRFKSNVCFDFPRTEFCRMRDIAFVVFFQTGFQILGTANVEMFSSCFVNENINIMEVRHNRESFRKMFAVMLCCIARLHLLCRLRRGSLPLRVRSSIHLLRNWLAEAKSRLRRDEDWWRVFLFLGINLASSKRLLTMQIC